MPRSSRHKSHKQSKHSSKDARERSDSEEDAKMKDRNGKEEDSVRVSRDSLSGEKRKLASHSRDSKDLSGHGNGDASEEYVASKRRKEKVDAAVAAAADRWNGGGDERGDGLVADKEMKGESLRLDSDKAGKVKSSIDTKSKPSRRHESNSEKKAENVGSVVEKEGSKSGKAESKRKTEKDSSRKEVHQYKDSKDKEHASERDRKVRDMKRDSEARAVDGEVTRKQGSQSVDFGDGRRVKQGIENTEWSLQDELRNLELEKELEKRIRKRRESSSDKDKYQDDARESDDRHLSLRGERVKDGRYKDERHKDGSYGDKYREDIDRDNRHRDGKQREDVDRDKRHRDDKYRDERTSRDRTSDKSDTKCVRDESNAAEIRHRKSRTQNSVRDGSPIYDDRTTRYKDDKGKRRSDDKEDHSDRRSGSTKEQRSDAEKKSMNSGKIESVTDRGRSRSRHADGDSTLSHNRRRSSPSSSSHVAKDQYRHSKQEESKYRDSVPEERVRHSVTSVSEVAGVSGVPEKTSVSRSTEKPIQKDSIHLGELSAERRPNSDTRTSPLQLVDKSPSSTSIDRRNLNRANVRRNLDVEESGQRGGGSKDAKDYSGNEGKRIRELPMDTLPVDELSQADGDTLSVSSPFSRTSHLPSNFKSPLPPPPPFRTGVDSLSVFGSSEDDNRGKLNNRYKRVGDSNMGRAQGNAWKGVPNWHSPVANGFIPFQHGPPPVGFHPVMQQFPAPPMFGVRPSMELNHTGVHYHIPDADRFHSHGRPFGWRNAVEDSCPTPLHGWDANNGGFGDESHIYGRLDWDHNRTLMSGRGWETSVDMWKGQNGGASMELPSALQKEDFSVRAPADEFSDDQSGQQAQNEQSQSDLQAENSVINQSSNALAKDTLEVPKTIPEETSNLSKISRNDDARLWHVYLSRLDISADLTHPELYDQCTSLMDMEQSTAVDVDASELAYVGEVIEARVKISNNTSSASLFAATNDSVFQRAMSLYKKQREEMRAILLPSLSNGEKVSNAENLEFGPSSDQEKVVAAIPFSNEDKPGVLVPTCDWKEAEGALLSSNQEKAETPIPFQKLEVSLATPYEKGDEQVSANSLEKPEEPISTLNKVKIELDPVAAHYEKGDEQVASDSLEKPEEPISTLINVKIEVDPVFNQEVSKDAFEDKFSSLDNALRAVAHSPSNDEDTNRASTSRGNHSGNSTEEQNSVDTMCGPLLISEVSSKACEAVMSESVESLSVNLSRIHHSPESTH